MKLKMITAVATLPASASRTKQGGKRTGAGRKPLPHDQRAVGVTVRVRPEIAARFAAWCAAKGISQALAFAAWVRRLQ